MVAWEFLAVCALILQALQRYTRVPGEVVATASAYSSKRPISFFFKGSGLHMYLASRQSPVIARCNGRMRRL